MTKKFLDSLVGMTPKDAKKACLDLDLDVIVIPPNHMTTLIALPRTVVLYETDLGLISHADAGDPLEIE